ncbi:MAG: neutral/alkaline ceramidase [Kineosporiaceae bacterium]
MSTTTYEPLKQRLRASWLALVATIALALAGVPALAAPAHAATNNYLVGAGIYDITGLVAEAPRFGFGDPFTKSTGLHDREYARAFIVADPATSQRVAYVTIDAGAMFQSVNQAVISRLSSLYGSAYTDTNVVITATHTHVAAGGASHYQLYKISTGGFYKATFDKLVNGIVGSIQRAHANLAPGRILMNTGSLTNASVNRSITAFARDPEAASSPSIDPEMTVLKFVQGTATEIGAITWFPTHATSLGDDYLLLSGDNKGYASASFEAARGADYGAKSFVAAFPQSNAGDMSPNLNMPPPGSTANATGPGATELESMQIIGDRQYQKAKALYDSASVQLTGPVTAVARYANYASYAVDPAFTHGRGAKTTCRGALGTSFASGAEDWRGPIALFPEGGGNSDLFWSLVGSAVIPFTAADSACQSPKPILVAVGNASPPWVPNILPTSIVRIGQFGVLNGPAEFTITAGRRLRSTVAAVPGTGLTQLVMSGYADAYSGYVTTYEEYQAQQYEGASTIWGPDTLGAYRTEFSRLARKLAAPSSDPWGGAAAPAVPTSSPGIDKTPPIVFDTTPPGASFGSVKTAPRTAYARGQQVSLQFWSAHPNNNLRTNGTYLRVQRQVSGAWVDVAWDRDQSTAFTWTRSSVADSYVTITWDIPATAAPGTYRVLHHGTSKSLFGALTEFTGTSPAFTVS